MKRWRPIAWLAVSVACFIAAIYFWRLGDKWQAQKPAQPAVPATVSNAPAAQANSTNRPIKMVSSSVKSASTAPVVALNPPATNSPVFKRTNGFPYRLSNTTKTIGQLARDNRALLLENALIDSGSSTALTIPDSLRSHGDPGAYIVQAQSPMNDFLRGQITTAGATIVSYIPNNAYLVTADASAASLLSQNFSVRPWEPYYKVKAALMPSALSGQGVPAANIAVFPGMLDQTLAALEKMKITVVSQSRYPFGTQLAVQNVGNLADVAALSGVQEIEPSVARISANDLTRVIMSDSVDVFTPTNYLGLSGSNVLVAVADSFIPTNGATIFNPDLTNIIGDPVFFPVGIADTEGHATHVGGIIAGSGLHSPTNAVGSQFGADFRGKAPLSRLLALPALIPSVSDATLQEATARTNALISNNSWGYGTSDYNLAAASYDQAVRDSLPGVTGSQPAIYVFAAGNSGQGDDGGQGGVPDTLLSPAVAKNAISVGASELPRNITNDVHQCDDCDPDPAGPFCTTNKPWQGMTDSQNQVARFSSRGNVGIGLEGDFGRFKPDVIAPGTFVVSTRSMTWDTNAYYNPVTVDSTAVINDFVITNSLTFYSVDVPCDAVQLTIQAVAVNPNPLDLPIYATAPGFPTFADLVGSNLVTGTTAGGPDFTLSPVDTIWNYAVGNPTNREVRYSVFTDLLRTNEMGNYWSVLQGLNDQLFSTNEPTATLLYRYESGTSMAAPAVSGTLALMEDFFTNQLKIVPSPALMKALIINGARSINPIYDFQVKNNINYQGWGLVNLTNSLPPGITNAFGAAAPMIMVDQDVTNALATGDSRTLMVQVNSNAQSAPLRITLVWTDPPGNPAASIKLVNNLDLIVTNMDDPTNPVVFFGNDFDTGNLFTSQWNGDTNNLPSDNVNNVENIYIPAALGTNYSVTVVARNVNVNAVTAHTNGVVQDYALVISSAEGGITNALMLANGVISPNFAPTVTGITNQFVDSPDTSGGLLIGQRVGASSPIQITNTLALTNQNDWGTDGQITIGVTNQWHFYVVTNTVGSNATATTFTNAAFATFLPVNLSIPPVGVNAANPSDATRPEADIDLYVARGSDKWGLTNLDPTIIANSAKSLSRGGTEVIVFSNAQPDEVFYVGVKAEDQEASEYDFLALFSENPFSSMGTNGEEVLHGLNVPTVIPDGTPERPGSALTVAIAVQPITVRRVVVTNIMEHENFGDLVGTLSHNRVPVVLNNHTFGNATTNQEFIYEDNDEGDIPFSGHPDGPGRLQDFIGQQGLGLWLLTEQDNTLFNTGRVDNIFIRLDPQGTNNVTATILPNHFFYDFIDVPPAGTNLTVCVNFIPPSTGPVQLYIRFGEQPTTNTYDYVKVINAPGDCLSISRADLPPLKPGRYYVGVFNPTTVSQTVQLTWTITLDPNGVTPTPITSPNPITSFPDDAVTNNSIFITNNQNIVTVNVGVVLNHPRVSDLDLTLVAPTGQRILLFENRGGFSATNMGHLNIFTNLFGQFATGGAAAQSNPLLSPTTFGILSIQYDFFDIPDRMIVFDGPLQIFDSGLVSGAGTFTIPFNLINGNTLNIVMNQGNNPVDTTQWQYTPAILSEDFTYLTFTDDTNSTDMPIKFAIPPYDGTDNGTNFTLSDFEPLTNREYFAPTNISDILGGWTMTTNDVFIRTNFFAGTNLLSMATNEVSVVIDRGTAINGSNYLALARGAISRTISLIPDKSYTINYFYRGPGIAGWWRGEGNATDSGDPETLGNNGSLIGRFNFPAGEVGQAFALEDPGLAFQFAGTNTYVQVRQSSSLNVGLGSGFTVEGWINPTNITFQQPMVEWLARVPTNSVVNGRSVSNLTILAGPFLNRATSHYYYLIGQTNWTTSELWANSLGGHLVEMDDANEQNWVYDTFAQFAGSNYTIWIGLTNGTDPNTNFVWSTGNSNVVYTNWAFGQPTNCPTSHYTAVLSATNGLPGLWTLLDNNGLTCSGGPTNKPFGVVEVDEIQTNGVQFWISVTNAANQGLGRLYANIYDTNGAPHEIFSPAGLIQSNVYQHVALTYDTNNGVATLYYSGTNVASTNLGVFVPKTGGDVLIGKDMSRITNNFFWGKMDEMSIYSRFLSPAEIVAIYRISVTTSNRNIGKFDPEITPAESLAEAQVSFGGITNLIFGNNRNWQVGGFSLKASSNSLPLHITGIEPGMLLDSFSIFQKPPGNLYYFPEQPLQALVGSNAFGNWTLEIRDARTGAVSTNAQLISWQLQFILQTNIPTPIQLDPQSPATNTIPPGQIGYFSVFVPTWANSANNVLVSATAPVDLLFNQTTPPGTGALGDFILLNNQTAGNQIISAVPPTTPPLVPGQTYYLGVRNNGTVPSAVVVRVDFNITSLTNGVPLTSTLNTNDVERPFVFNVSSNATEATFQLLKMTGNADLVLRKGLPIPTLLSADYGSFAGSNADETIYVLTNSLPVPLSTGPWDLDVIKRNDLNKSNAVTYSVLAKELTNLPTIITLSNRVPMNFTAGPGAALTNFFKFSVTNFPLATTTNLGIHFELFNQTGNGDLTVQTNALPLAPPFLQSSRLPFNNAEIIFIRTNTSVTNLNADWYLGVPNNETNPISFTILAEIDTNSFAAFPTAEGAGAYTRGGGLSNIVYHVTSLSDSGFGSLRDGVNTLTNGGTIVFDIFGTINLSAPLFITNSYLTIAGQTAPGSGITVAGFPTYVQGAHDIVMRYLRFRPPGANIGDSLQITNVADAIVDHISAAYGTNDIVSVLNSSNITIQWSVLAENLNTTNIASGGSEIRYGFGDVTFHHNLYADNYSGNPTVGEDVALDFVNNVIFNWGIFAGFSTNDLVNNPGGLTNLLNYSANYLIAGSNSVFTNVAFWSGSTNTWIFQTNNFIDTNKNIILDGANTSWGMFSNQYMPFNHAFDIAPPTVPDEAFIAYERVLDFAGTSLEKRDPFDRGVVQRVRLQPAVSNPTIPLSGMIAWWHAEGDAADSAGANNGVLVGGLSFAPGEVAQGFNFTGGGTYVSVPATPSLNVGTSNGFTIEGWIKPNNVSAEASLVEWTPPSSGQGVHLAISTTYPGGGGPGALYANILDTTLAVHHRISSAPGTITNGGFQHVAVTYDKITGQANLYYDGSNVASQNLGIFTPETADSVLLLGYRRDNGENYSGILDEFSVYGRALAPCEIAAIYNAGSAGKQSILAAATNSPVSLLPYLDVDHDGIPDFWEITLNESPTNFSAISDRDGDAYTDLEEYMNWLGVPHALTLHDTQTNVDLYTLSGNTGNLLFGVANGTNGTVYLTNLDACATGPEHVAIFTPTNNFGNGTNGGFASFSYMVTNTDTMAYFGPVTVSVFVSTVNITNAGSTNTITFTNPPPNQVVFEMVPLSITNGAVDSDGTATLTYTISTIIDTNATVANGWPLTNLTLVPSPIISPTGVITWTPNEYQGPGVYIITTTVADNGLPVVRATNSFQLTVNESNLPPVFVATPPNLTNTALVPIVVTNLATDPDIPFNPLTYTLLNPPAGMTIDPVTAVITWAPTLFQTGIFTITTVVTDTNAYAPSNNSLSATNTFTIVVNPAIAPFAFTQPAQAVTGTSAKLNGMATPNGLPTMAWFEWGTNTLYGNQTTPVSVGNSFNVTYTSANISGLTPNVPYHFRLVVSNLFGGPFYGFDQILDEANVVAWGADYVHQVEVPSGLSNAVAVAGAYDHSLALKNDGTVVAWGDGTANQTNVPPGLNSVLAIAGGQYSSIALKNNGTVVAWGPQLLNVTNVPPGLNNVVMIASGTTSSFALRNNGSIVSWGANLFNVTNPPPGLNNVVEVAGGSYHALAIRNDGTVVAWGNNGDGETNVPPSATNIVAIAAGNYHSLALRYDGTVVAWGENSAGQTNVPAGLSNVVAVTAGAFHSLALRSDGTVVGWGDNTAGQAGIPSGLTNVVAISSGYFHNLALTPTLLTTNPIILNITNGLPETNSILGGSTVFYRVNVPVNADAATNGLIFTVNGPLNIWYSTNTPPTVGQPVDFQLLTNALNGTSIVAVATSPQLMPGTTYYLGVQNTNTIAISYALEVDFHLTVSQPQTNTIPISSIIHTNINGTNGFLLIWFAPTNDLFQVQWANGLPPVWNTFTNIVGYNMFIDPTNSEFEFFDDGSQSGGFTSGRFYQLILLNSAAPLPAPTPLTNGVPATNTVAPGSVTFYQVDVPGNVNYATNSLLFGTAPLNLWFTTNVPPTITNSNDVLLLGGSTNGAFTSVVASTGPPAFAPNSTYYLGVQNTNAVAVNYAVQVDFHVIGGGGPSTNTIPISGVIHTNFNGTNGFLLVWFAPTNDLFQVQWAAGLPPIWNTFTNIIGFHTFIDPTNSEFEFFDDGSQTGGFTPGRFYQLILLNSGVVPPPPPAPILLTNAVPATNTVAAGTVTFYQVDVPINVDDVTNSLFSGTAPLNLWFTTNVPPTVTNATDFHLFTNATTGSFTSVVGSGAPPSFVPGTTYYLGVQNTNASAVTYSVRVDFHFVANQPQTNTIPISGVVHTNMNGTNGFLLVWFAPTNDLFQVQWAAGLPPAWNTFTNIIGFHTFINPTNSEFEFFDDGSQSGGFTSGRFYQLILLNSGVVPPPPSPLTNGAPTAGSIAPGTVTFYQVNVPNNVDDVTNLLLSGSAPLNFWFTTNVPPTVTNATDRLLITNASSGSFTSVAGSGGPPSFVAGTTYYLGVQNTNASTATYSVRVDFHVSSLSTNVPPISNIVRTNVNGTNDFLLVWYAPTNDLFQVQWSSGLGSGWNTFSNIISYSTFIDPTNSQFTFLDDGSQSGGLGAFRFYRLILYNGAAPSITIVPLANGVPMNFTTGAGLTNFFSFDITQTNAAVLFELYNLTGNGDLTAQKGSLPVTPTYTSLNSSTNFEQIVIRTNAGLPNLNAVSWFLGVPNQGASPISYTIRAVVPTNGMLMSGLPLNQASARPGGSNVQILWGPTVVGEKYQVRTNGSLGAPNWVAVTDILATGTSATFTDPHLPSGLLFYDVVQVP